MKWFVEAPKPTDEQLKEIKRLKAEAADRRKRAEESFQRSDTDGFLSQWALNMTARLNEATVRLLQHGGCARFPVLCDADGNVVADKVYEFADRFRPDQWNNPTVKRWRLPDDLAEKLGRKWVPVRGYNGISKIQNKLGLHEEDRWFPAYAKLTTGGRKSTGLAGCANAFVATFKVGEE